MHWRNDPSPARGRQLVIGDWCLCEAARLTTAPRVRAINKVEGIMAVLRDPGPPKSTTWPALLRTVIGCHADSVPIPDHLRARAYTCDIPPGHIATDPDTGASLELDEEHPCA